MKASGDVGGHEKGSGGCAKTLWHGKQSQGEAEEGVGVRPCQLGGTLATSLRNHGNILATFRAPHRDSVQLNEWMQGRMNE